MLFDKLFKKKTVNNEETTDITDAIHEKNVPEGDEEKYETSQAVYEKPNLDFLKDDQPIDDVLKELGLDAADASLEGIDQEKYIQSMLEEANDILGSNIDLDSIMSGEADNSIELDALKSTLAVPKAAEPDSKKTEPINFTQSGDNNMAAQSEYDMLFGTTDYDNLDKLINTALERDKYEESLTDFDDANLDFISDTSVFQDDKLTHFDKYEKPKPKYVELIENASPKKLNIIAAALGVLIVIVVAAASFIALNNTRARIIANQPGGAVIAQPKAPVNNANYIYVNLGLKFNNDTLVLNKIIVDSLCTGFYFNKNIDLQNIEVTLKDDIGNSYAPELSFNRLMQNSAELWFQPLKSNVRYFFLYLKDKQTTEEIVYEFSLNGKVFLPEARYAGRSKDLMSNNPDLKVFIEDMAFSSSGTYMNYSMSWSDDFMILQLGRKNDAQMISITEDGRNLSPIGAAHDEYLFEDENMILGHMEFAPLRSLNSNITVKFTDLYRRYNLNMDIPAGNLFRYKTEPETVLELYDYKLVLERAGWQGEKLILVCHSEALNLYAVSGVSQDNDNRTETILDVTAKIATPEGEIVLKGDCRSSALGTDIIFEAGDAYGKARTAGYDNIVFNISNAYIKNEDISVSYNLDSKRAKPDAETSLAKSAFITAFESRLAFKSGLGDVFSVTGFSEELSLPEKLMRDYSPIPDTEAVYTAQVLTMSLNGDRAHAIIAEYWKGHIEGRIEGMQRLHKINALADAGGWIIVSDEIIEG